MSVFGSKSSKLRLAKPEKCEFTTINDHFEGKYNENIRLYGQTQINLQKLKSKSGIKPKTTALNFIRVINIYVGKSPFIAPINKKFPNR